MYVLNAFFLKKINIGFICVPKYAKWHFPFGAPTKISYECRTAPMCINVCFILRNFFNIPDTSIPWFHIFFSDVAFKTSNLWSFFEEGNKYPKTIFYFNSQIFKRKLGR